MTTPTQQVTVMTPGQAVLQQPQGLDQRQLGLLKRTLCADANGEELMLLGEVSRATGADPFRGDVFLLIYNKDNPAKRKPTFIFSAQYATKRANQAGILAGTEGPLYCGPDGKWREVWLDEASSPVAAKLICKRVVRNADGSVHSIIEEPTVVTWKSAYRETDQWNSDGVWMLGVAVKRRAMRKLDVPMPELEQLGVDHSIGEPGHDFNLTDGTSRPLTGDSLGSIPGVPDQSIETVRNLMAAAGLVNDDLNPVISKVGEVPQNRANFEPRIDRWFKANPEKGALDLVDRASAIKRGVNPDTGEMPRDVTPADTVDSPESRAEGESDGKGDPALHAGDSAPVTSSEAQQPGLMDAKAETPIRAFSDDDWHELGEDMAAKQPPVVAQDVAKVLGKPFNAANVAEWMREHDAPWGQLVDTARVRRAQASERG